MNKGLSFSDRIARHAWRLTPQRTLSGVIGWWAERRVPLIGRTRVLSTFAATYGIDISEAEHPLALYASLDEFFTRRLRPGARPIDADPAAVVAPADGRVVATGQVQNGGAIEAKNILLSAVDLLSDSQLAQRFEGGQYQVTYLSPRDYHRVHVPCSGKVQRWHHLPGKLFPVNDGSVRREPDLFSRNERFVTVFSGAMGTFAVVMVAAVGVGHITAAYDLEVKTRGKGVNLGEIRSKVFTDPPKLDKGDELGIFHLGSTTIVLFEPGRVTLETNPPGQNVKMGARIGTIIS